MPDPTTENAKRAGSALDTVVDMVGTVGSVVGAVGGIFNFAKGIINLITGQPSDTELIINEIIAARDMILDALDEFRSEMRALFSAARESDFRRDMADTWKNKDTGFYLFTRWEESGRTIDEYKVESDELTYDAIASLLAFDRHIVHPASSMAFTMIELLGCRLIVLMAMIPDFYRNERAHGQLAAGISLLRKAADDIETLILSHDEVIVQFSRIEREGPPLDFVPFSIPSIFIYEKAVIDFENLSGSIRFQEEYYQQVTGFEMYVDDFRNQVRAEAARVQADAIAQDMENLGVNRFRRVAQDFEDAIRLYVKRMTVSQHVFARNTNTDLIHYYWSPMTDWAAENKTQTVRLPPEEEGNRNSFRIAGDLVVINLLSGNTQTQHVFGRNANGDLIDYYWWAEEGWRVLNQTQTVLLPPEEEGNRNSFRITGNPVVVNYSDRQDVFGRNALGELIHYYWWAEGGWRAVNHTHSPRVGNDYRIAGNPVVINYDSGGDAPTQNVFGRNAVGDLIEYAWWPEALWDAWNLTQPADIGNDYRIASDPVVINLESGDMSTQHVFARNVAGDLIHYCRLAAGSWKAENLTQDYTNIGSERRIASDPVVINLQSGDTPTQHVFGRNAAGDLIHYYWWAEVGWHAENLTQDYRNIGNEHRIASNPVVINLEREGTPIVQHVFGRNTAGDLIHYYWWADVGWHAENLTRRANIGNRYRIASNPVVINLERVGEPIVQHVFACNAAGDLIHYYWSPSPSWAAENLTQDYMNIGNECRIASDPVVISLE